MISEKLKIDFDNLKVFEEYRTLLFNAITASERLDSAIGSTMGYGKNVPHNQLFKKVENDARYEHNMLYDKINIWKFDWSKIDKNKVIAPGEYYKCVSHRRDMCYRDEKICTLFHILRIECPDNNYEVPHAYEGETTVFYETICITSSDITVTGKNIVNDEYSRDEHNLIEPFVANVISGKYQKIDKSEWDNTLSFYNERLNIYNHFIREDNGKAEE